MSDSTIPEVGDVVTYNGRQYEVFKVVRTHVGLTDPSRPAKYEKNPDTGVLQETAHLAVRIGALG